MTLAPVVLTALATGVLGSPHCAAMCGPLAIAGCPHPTGRGAGVTLAYFGGRFAGYATMGALLGHLGRHALCLLPMAAVENVATAGVALAAGYRGVTLLRRRARPEPLARLRRKPRSGLLTLLADLWPRRGLALGLATAVMPCGLLIPAWALAAGTASAPLGAAVMAAFSIATLPGLIVPLAGRRLARGLVSGLPAVAHGLLWCALALWIACRPLLVASGACHP